MKKFFSGFLVGAFLFSGISVFATTQFVASVADFKVFVNGAEFKGVTGEVLVVEGRTYLPLRDMGAALDVAVNWNSELGCVEIGNSLSQTLPEKSSNKYLKLAQTAYAALPSTLKFPDTLVVHSIQGGYSTNFYSPRNVVFIEYSAANNTGGMSRSYFQGWFGDGDVFAYNTVNSIPSSVSHLEKLNIEDITLNE